MKKDRLNFILTECTFLRYYGPIIEAAEKNKITCNMFLGRSNKYNCPRIDKNKKEIEALSKDLNFNVSDISKVAHLRNENFITVEGCGIGNIHESNRIYSLTYMTDFNALYKRYIDKVHRVIFPSKAFPSFYGIEDHKKHLYLGSPKYDIVNKLMKRERIEKVYNNKKIDIDNKKCLVMFPRNRDLNNVNLKKIYEILKNNNYDLIVKTRGKDPVFDSKLRGDYCFQDDSWYPHTTMELLSISDIVINFSSTVVKESTMMKKPMINFHIKPFKKPLEELYSFNFVHNMKIRDKSFSESEFEEAVKIFENNSNLEYNDCIEKFLSNNDNVSQLIIDNIISEN